MDFNNTATNLEILAEEAGEIIEVLSRVIRMKSKIFRFGLSDFHPKNQMPNDLKLEEEIGHFIALKNLLVAQGVLSEDRIQQHALNKLDSMAPYYQSLKITGETDEINQ
jgi:NTP pyrophosphatase (non-canonical NTP hydrolase)